MFKSNIFKFILFSLFVVLFIFLIVKKRDASLKRKWSNEIKDTVIGKVIGYETGGKGTVTAVLEYVVKDRKIHTNIVKDAVIDELFLVTFSLDNPESSKVSSLSPLTLKNEEFSFSIGKLTDYHSILAKRYIYKYWVNGVVYEHFYYPAKNSKVLYPNIKIGQLFKVKYLTSNPRRSKILFDEPIENYSEWWTYKYSEAKGFYKE